jgi:hypothetical protein
VSSAPLIVISQTCPAANVNLSKSPGTPKDSAETLAIR